MILLILERFSYQLNIVLCIYLNQYCYVIF